MNSGSREFDFNTMADMGKQVSENKKALDDVRSSFVGPTQEEEAPEPTPVILDGSAIEEGDNKVNLNELAYAAKRRMEEEGHPAADILLTPNNVKKLAEFETKARRVEKERLAYEADPENYDLNSANALDAYTKSWNLKHLSPEQLHPGPSTWKPGAADEAAPASVDKEVPRVAPDRGEAMPVVRDGPAGGEAPAPRRQSAGGSERPASANKVSASKSAASTPAKGSSKIDINSLGNFNRVPSNPHKMVSKGMSFEAGPAPEKGMASYEDPRMVAWDRAVNAPPEQHSKVGALKPGDKFYNMRGANPDNGSAGVEYQATMGQMLPSVLAAAPAAAMLKEGIPGKMAEKVETELIPGAMNMGRKLASKLASKEEAPAAKVAQEVVNNNISRVPKPKGLVKASLPEKPSGKGVRQQIQQAEAAVAPKPRAPVNKRGATEASHKASEYLEKRDASAASKERTKANIKQKKTQGKGQNL